MVERMINAAHSLKNEVLDNEWTVLSQIERSPDDTGGHFSVGYIVRDENGREAFLKALDYSKAFSSPDPARVLQNMTSAFNFERDILKICGEKNLDRVVKAIDNGTHKIESAAYPVDYIVFELADGDIRDYLRMSEAFDLAMILRTLHNTAVGLKQLHSEGIAHQDLKPSNVLIFNVLHVAKIADVGRATKRGRNAPHEDVEVPGALAYAPPELLYGYIDPDWNKRRLGCDLYLLGSLVFFLFTNVSMTAAILSKLHPMHRHNNWTDTYEHVLPYIRDAFNSTIEELEQCLPISIRMEISQITRQLCEPKPEKRGHPKEKIGTANRYSLQRYISRFDVLASKAEARLLGD